MMISLPEEPSFSVVPKAITVDAPRESKQVYVPTALQTFKKDEKREPYFNRNT
jgi:hypothetical protein